MKAIARPAIIDTTCVAVLTCKLCDTLRERRRNRAKANEEAHTHLSPHGDNPKGLRGRPATTQCDRKGMTHGRRPCQAPARAEVS
jgi:hypothetical protein